MKASYTLLASILLGFAIPSVSYGQVSIPDGGWHLWPDTKAAWQNDTLYLPDEVDLAKLPTNPPTGGWQVLEDKTGVVVTLPTTVEQHYWGKFGFKPYKGDYYFGDQDFDVQNGNYEGVSWWWRDIDVPANFKNKLVVLSVRGMRQRAEIYVNQKLVGYDLIAETSFKCDVSKAIIPGQKNQLAIRITNPGGMLDWRDSHTLKWGNYTFQKSHGFGGLDRGLTLEAHDPVYLDDTWVLNTPQVRTVTAHATIKNTTDQPVTGVVTWTIEDPQAKDAVKVTQKLTVTIAAHSDQSTEKPLTYDQAELWDLATPRLYSMKAHWESTGATSTTDDAERTFGFRWFEPKGLGHEAGLYLNDRRVRLITAISWGYWGFNGLWPTQDLAEKEVNVAKQLNMNCLNFHRDIGKEDVLAAQDRLGLLRYMEPGGGMEVVDPKADGAVQTPGEKKRPDTRPLTFGEKYERFKVLRMIQQFRSHPSLVIYVLQNEIDPKFNIPLFFSFLKQMHQEDPSRAIVVKSGVKTPHEALYMPYDDKIHYDDGTGFSGWSDEHTVGGPGVWTDDLYKDPDHFTHKSDDLREIVDWGEMLGSGVPDNHPVMIRQILAGGGESYDLKDHQEIAAAYDQYLDKWNFRTAFPTSEKLFTDIGDKSYDFWGRVIETARLSEANDILSISGWESTAIENHSGIVDNMRNFKGDPDLISVKLRSLLPVVEPRGVVYRVGEKPVLDLYLLNETGNAAGGQLELTITDPKGNTKSLGSFSAPAYIKDKFVYPVRLALDSTALESEGEHRLDFTLTEKGKVLSKNSTTIYAVQTPEPEAAPAPTSSSTKPVRIGLIGDLKEAELELKGVPNLTVEPYQDKGTYDVLAAFIKTHGLVKHITDGTKIQNTQDDALYHNSMSGRPGDLKLTFTDLPAGKVRLSLYFDETRATGPGQRVFNLDVNGQTVLKNLDIFAEAGGTNTALVKTMMVDAPNGTIEITPSNIKVDADLVPSVKTATINAVKIEAGAKVVAVCCGGEAYTDKSGLIWQPYVAPDAFPEGLLSKVKSGLPLLLMLNDPSSASQTAQVLADSGAFTYSGMVGASRASWMGSWIFVRDHPVYAGLPVNTVMKGYYQVAQTGQCGLLIDGPKVEVIAAYSRDHDRHIGAATLTTKLGEGTVLIQTVSGMHPVMLERWLSNAINFLTHN